MLARLRFSRRTVAALYGLLALLILGVVAAMALLPRQAVLIRLVDAQDRIIAEYRAAPDGSLRYRLGDRTLKVYAGGEVVIHPLDAVKSITIK